MSPLPEFSSALTADVEYLDLGSSEGGSLIFGRRFASEGARGLGIDLDPRKVKKARAANLDVVRGDATCLGLAKAVRFVTMFHFLEHLPSLDVVSAAVRSAADGASDFIYIRHPSFEGQEYLHSLGLRQYWWHWRGHPSHITVRDYHNIFADLGLRDYVIQHCGQVFDSAHPSVLSVDSPIDSQSFDPARHPPKPNIRFTEPVWISQQIWILLRPFEPEEFAELIALG